MNEYISVQGEGEMNKCEYYDRMGCCAPEKVSTEYCSTCNHTFGDREIENKKQECEMVRMGFRDQMEKIPQKNFYHANRYDDDKNYILHIWDDSGNSYDIICHKKPIEEVTKTLYFPSSNSFPFPLSKEAYLFFRNFL